LSPLTLSSRAVSMRSVQTEGSVQAHRARTSPACLALLGTLAGCHSCDLSFTHPPSCAPFAPRPLQAAHRYYGRSDSCMGLRPHAGLPASRACPSDHSVSKHLTVPCRRFRTLPFSATGFPFGSGLRHCLAGSPEPPGRIEFVAYGLIVHLWLLPTPSHGDAVTFGYRPENASLEGTLTLLYHARSQAH
jgi:hypothetical protein